ncbi:MAG TPA: DsbA family protein [Terriglobales bacterium]|nr:DsbA family protein [Terriglobales bacterium]
MRSITLLLLSLRRFLAPFLALVIIGCSAQTPAPSTPTALDRRIQNQIRSQLGVPPNVEITLGQRKPSEIAGYETLPVTLSSGDRKLEVPMLISTDNKTLARLDKFDLSADVMAKIDVGGRPVRGNREAKVTIVNYDDFQCPFCSRMHETLMAQVMKTYGDKVKIIYKDYPLLSIHPWAMHAAINANCLSAQSNEAYWEFADYVHANHETIMGPQEKRRPHAQQVMALDKAAFDQGAKHRLDSRKLSDCIGAQEEKAVRVSMAEAEKLGVESTPTLFVNGEKMSGALPWEVMRAVLDRALKAEGIMPPAPPKVNIVPTPEALPK